MGQGVPLPAHLHDEPAGQIAVEQVARSVASWAVWPGRKSRCIHWTGGEYRAIFESIKATSGSPFLLSFNTFPAPRFDSETNQNTL